MINSKLIELLRHFNAKQLRLFGDFVASPFFNKNDELGRMYAYLRTYGPRFVKKAALSKQSVFSASVPGSTYDEKKMGYLMSDMHRLIEQFLVVSKQEQEQVKSMVSLLSIYDDLGLEKHFNKTLRESRKALEESAHRNADFYYLQYLVDRAETSFLAHQRKHKAGTTLQSVVDNLDMYYLANKLLYSGEILNRQNVVSADYKVRLLDEILQNLESHPGKEAPVVSIYYQVLMCLREPGQQGHYGDLKQLLIDHTAEFPKEEAYNMYFFALNYCIKKINSGEQRYLTELFKLYQTMIENNLLYIGKHLSQWTYKNVVQTGLRLNEHQWVEQFIHQQKDFLPEHERENAISFNLASLYFDKADYDRAFELLNNVEYSDIMYNLGAKSMLIRIYYELQEIDSLYSLLDAYNIYLKRNKLISQYYRKINLNMVKFVKSLLKLRKGENDKALALKTKLNETKEVAYSNWLHEKLDKLITKAPKVVA